MSRNIPDYTGGGGNGGGLLVVRMASWGIRIAMFAMNNAAVSRKCDLGICRSSSVNCFSIPYCNADIRGFWVRYYRS